MKHIRLPVAAGAAALVCVLLAGQASAQSQPGPGPVTASSCSDLVKAHPGAPCSFDFANFRSNDDRVTIIETKGIQESGLFRGRTFDVRDPRELGRISRQAGPGDQIVLANGTWKDVRINFSASGTRDQPVIIRPESPGGVTFSGTSSLRVWGDNIIVHDIAFKEGAIDKDSFVVVGLGGGVGRPCNGCVVNRLVVDDYNSAPDRYATLMVIYLQLQGENITVANSEFRQKENVGPVVHGNHPLDRQCSASRVSEGKCFQRLLFTNNLVSDFSRDQRRKRSPRGKYKILELGGGNVATAAAYSVIQDNIFEYADGGTNTLSLKTSDVIIRRNRFIANLGTLNLRSSNRVLIENNVFDGTGREGMGGVLVQGKGHWIVRNLFRNLVHPLNDYHFPISMPAALDEDLRDGANDYARVKDVVIAGNLFAGVNRPPIKIGVFPLPAKGRNLQPTNVFLLGNEFSFAAQKKSDAESSADAELINSVSGPAALSGWTLRDNIVAP